MLNISSWTVQIVLFFILLILDQTQALLYPIAPENTIETPKR